MIYTSLLICAALEASFALNVLVWNPAIAHSHMRFMGNIADILVDDGHNVLQRQILGSAKGGCMILEDMDDFMKLNQKVCKEEKTGAVLLNTVEVTKSPRPTANILRYIGGATLREPKKLNAELDALLNKRPQTVLSKHMPMRLKQEIIAAFASFPNTTFIWKYEEENDAILFKKYPNIYTMKWVPQTDLLADKRLSLFITHAGMNSVLEAVFSGKPMVTVPLLWDQVANAKNAQSRGVGIMIDKHDLNRDTLVAAI
ncbi:unnamed protein product [Cylicocyclus nassatus]|uniref:UDP-glucuronosyltransferase n=1 Tax=Cylicocyclus nassatus TaxID=53992 RepID=A0AA36GJN4_CYLNA|nr:unnamed protein product [Cylicocyclus nassatus]